jgi:hypothetical protein
VQPTTDSLANRIAALPLGESLSMTNRLPIWQKHAIPDPVTDKRRRLKNNVAPHVQRAVARSGGTFTVDSTVCLNHAFTHLLVSVVITRTSGKGWVK